MFPLDAIILPRNNFSDHRAVYAEYLINTTAPTKQLSPALHNAQQTTISGEHIANQKAQLPTSRPTKLANQKAKEGQGAALNVLLSSKQQLIKAILEGNTRPIDPPPDIPEDDKILQSKSLPKM